MLEHEPYGAVRLTEAGREKALKIYRRHEIISSLFIEMLGMDKSQANNLACIMEHEMDKRRSKNFLLWENTFSGVEEKTRIGLSGWKKN